MSTGKLDSKAKLPPAHTKYQAIIGVLEIEKKTDEMLLVFEEINSTIGKYLNNLESDDDK